MARRSSFPWKVLGDRSGQAALLILALLFVGMVTYLPHMGTMEGRLNPTGAIEEPSEEYPWKRFIAAYAELATGEREDYRYPMHVDEHVHWVRGSAVQRDETLRFDNPYTGTTRTEVPLTLRGLIHESGFWVASAQFQQMTGIEWLQIIRFAPALFAMVTASLVWAALRPSPMAPLAAAFVALVPTTPRFLGIGFFVPIGLGLAWVAAALLLSRGAYRSPRWFIFTIVVGAWAFFIHLIAGFAFLLVLAGAAIASWRESHTRTVLLGLGVALPFIAFYDAFQASFSTELEKIGTLPVDFTVFDQLGRPFLALWVLGMGMALLYPPTGRVRTPLFAAALTSLLAFAFIVASLLLGNRLYALYDRWHPIFALSAAVPVAWAIYKLWWVLRELLRASLEIVATRRGSPQPWRHSATAFTAIGLILVSATFVGAAAPGVQRHLDEPYYRVMDDEAWDAFQIAASVAGPEYEVFLTHPWQAPVFTAMTGRYPHTWLNPGEPPVRGQDYEAYSAFTYADGTWLVERDISLVIHRQAPADRAFQSADGRVHLLDPTLANMLHDVRARD